MDPEEQGSLLCYCSLLGLPLSVDGHCKVCVHAPWFWDSTLLTKGPLKNKNLICLPKNNDSGFNQKPMGCFVHHISRTLNFPTNQRTQISATVMVNMKTENNFIMMYFTVSETVGKTSGRLGKNWHVLNSPCEAFCPCHFSFWGMEGAYIHI